MTEQEWFDAELESNFQGYCKAKGIRSEQYMDDIRPVWDAAFRAGAQIIMLSPHKPGDLVD